MALHDEIHVSIARLIFLLEHLHIDFALIRVYYQTLLAIHRGIRKEWDDKNMMTHQTYFADENAAKLSGAVLRRVVQLSDVLGPHVTTEQMLHRRSIVGHG